VSRQAIALIAGAVLAATPAAQEPPRPAFRVGAEMVVVDLVATDRAGNAVRDLQASEIQILEDGRPQKIEFVRVVRSGSGAPASGTPPAGAAAAAAAMPGPTAASPGTLASDTALVIAIDLGSMPTDAFPRVREAIQRLLREDLPPNVPVMLTTLWHGATIRQPLTTDRAAVLAAVDALPSGIGDQLTLLKIVESIETACASSSGKDPTLIDSAVNIGRVLLNESRVRLREISETLSSLSRSLAVLPGRKHVVFYSAGYFVDPLPDVIEAVTAAVTPCTLLDTRRIAQELSSQRVTDALAGFQTAIDRANRSQVSFYAIDARGLIPTNLQAQQRGFASVAKGGALQKITSIETRTQDFLEAVARSTGGRHYVNSNDLTQGLRRAWLDASEYYLLGYAPAGNRRKGQFHKIEVKIARPDVSARYRQGYYELTEHELAVADVESAFKQPDAFRHPGFDGDADIIGTRLKVTALIKPAMIRFTSAGGSSQALFSLHATLRDAKGALVGGKPLFGRDISLNLNAEKLAGFLGSDNIELPTDAVAPPPGTYQLTVVVRDSGGWLAARTIELTVGQ
jgi:VWFA-related protein